MIRFAYLDSGVSVDDTEAKTEEEVREVARRKFIAMLNNNEFDLLIEEEED